MQLSMKMIKVERFLLFLVDNRQLYLSRCSFNGENESIQKDGLHFRVRISDFEIRDLVIKSSIYPNDK